MKIFFSVSLLWLLSIMGPMCIAEQTTGSESDSNALQNSTSVGVTSDKEQVGSAVFTANPMVVMFGLLLIVCLIILIAWMLRSMGAVPLAADSSMKVVSGVSVGTREKVILIDVGGRQILLGVAPGQVSHLHSFEEPVIKLTHLQPSPFSLKFKQLLRESIGKKPMEGA